ncbi:MAG TPA: ribonuclease HII [Longimicrobiaceae bacterium]|nr:ribonuclease HII [Longimicrobiaceae bacterium]
MSDNDRMSKRASAGDSERLRDPLSIERGFWSRGVSVLAGVDEAGRGPLAGPVVAAAVILPAERCVAGADDSKRLAPARQEELVEAICSACVAFGIGAASAREIDGLNIRRATALAMLRAVAHLPVRPDHLLVDGLPVPELGEGTHTAVVEGDRRVHCISCASILAKVVRDRLMVRLAHRYPQYGWERNKGYATAEHLEALARFGPTPHHRRTFAPVQLTFDAL